MSQFRASLARFSESKSSISVVGRASAWSHRNTLCIDHFVVDGDDGWLFEEHHVHIDMLDEDRSRIAPGDWVEVQGLVYRYENKSAFGVRQENFSVRRKTATRLWRPSTCMDGDIAYCYANQVDIVRALRKGNIFELDDHFTTKPDFDPLFQELVESPNADVDRWVSPGEDLWFFRIKVKGPFIDWKTFKASPACRPKWLQTHHGLSKYYTDLVVEAGSRPLDWRFSQTPVDTERWLEITPLKPTEGIHRNGRPICKRI